MQIASLIMSQVDEDSDLALDLSAFLLRYNRELDYSDFSDDPQVQNMLRRAESYRAWADIEDLANGFESFSSGFE